MASFPRSGNNRILPHAQISTGFPYGSFFRTSGDKYPGVPAKPENFYHVRVSYKNLQIMTHRTMPADRLGPRWRDQSLLTWLPPLWLYLPAINFQAERANIKVRWILYVSIQECQRNERSENFPSWQRKELYSCKIATILPNEKPLEIKRNSRRTCFL